MIRTAPPPFRTIRVICASIAVHEQLLKLAYEGGEEHWRIQRILADLGRQLDEAEALWARHNKREPAKLPRDKPLTMMEARA
jgi:hypothetical protein